MIYKIKEPIYICGDLHGNFHWIKPYIEMYGLSDCSLIFCGDVGLGFMPVNVWHNFVSDLKLVKCLKKHNIDCYFIRGNHDDPSWFNNKVLHTKHFKAVSDYSTLSSPNHNILCIGGGISIDRIDRKTQMQFSLSQYLKYHTSATLQEAKTKITPLYWENEAPVYNEGALDKLTYQIDTVCSHVAPKEFIPYTKPGKIWLKNDSSLLQDCENERQVLSNVLAYLLKHQHPVTNWFYGHYHFYENNKVGNINTTLLDMARNKMLFIKELKS